jgi:prepilin-type N-terminal cleavage/methylation domain-containing protein
MRSDRRGFTLIEMMIAVTLVAAISTTMLFAIRTALITLQKTDDRLMSNRRVMSVERILDSELGGVMPVIAFCADNSQMPIFNGNDQTLHLITTYSLTEGARGYPRVIELQVLPADGGGVRLIANEFPYSGPYATAPLCAANSFRVGVPTPQSFVIADRLAYCHISYQDRDATTYMGTVWLPQWSKPNLPAAVHVEMAPLIPDPARLPLVSVTVPIHINRDVNGTYTDSQ